MKRMKRVALIVLDGVGCGAQPDANKYGDTGADTLGHVWTQEDVYKRQCMSTVSA